MRNFFNKLSPKTFQVLCILLCLAGDLSFSGYIYNFFSDKDSFLKNYEILREPLLQAFKKQGMILPKNFEHEIFHIMIQSLLMMIALFIFFHLIIYLFYYFNKRFAFLYIRLLGIFGTLGGLSFISSAFSNSVIWGILFILVTVAYIFISFGTYHFPINSQSKLEQ